MGKELGTKLDLSLDPEACGIIRRIVEDDGALPDDNISMEVIVSDGGWMALADLGGNGAGQLLLMPYDGFQRVDLLDSLRNGVAGIILIARLKINMDVGVWIGNFRNLGRRGKFGPIREGDVVEIEIPEDVIEIIRAKANDPYLIPDSSLELVRTFEESGGFVSENYLDEDRTVIFSVRELPEEEAKKLLWRRRKKIGSHKVFVASVVFDFADVKLDVKAIGKMMGVQLKS